MTARQLAYCAARFAFFVGVCALAVTPLAYAQERPTREAFMFSHADADGDGRLSRAEFAAVYHALAPRDGAPPKPGGSALAFEAADADSDGFVSREEFMAWFRNR